MRAREIIRAAVEARNAMADSLIKLKGIVEMEQWIEKLAREWHGGQSSSLYALQCGDRSVETLEGAAVEFRDCGEHVAARYCDNWAELGGRNVG